MKKVTQNQYKKLLTSITDDLNYLSKNIDPYAIEFVRSDVKSIYDILYILRKDIIKFIEMSKDIKDYSYLTNDKKLLDIRFISNECGIEKHGLLCKFLEKMHIRFLHNQDLLILDVLKYKTDNSLLKIEIAELKNKIYHLKN